MQESPDNVDRDRNAAEILKLTNAADKGDVDAIIKMADVYEHGLYGKEVDYEQVLKWLMKGVELGNGLCMAKAGYVLTIRLGQTKENMQKGIEMYRNAIDAGNIDAVHELLKILNAKEEKSKEDWIEIAQIRKKGAELGDPDIMWDYAWMCYSGSEIEKNLPEAVIWGKKAADCNNKPAQFFYGNLCRTGEGVPQNFKEAVFWYQRTIHNCKNLHVLGNAFNNLGLLYQWGKGVKKDIRKCIKCLKEATKLGNKFAFYNLGRCYENGWGVPKDISRAFALYSKADGAFLAYHALGRFYERGIGVKRDPQKAAEYYEMALQGDHFAVWYDYGVFLKNRDGGEQDLARADDFFKKAYKDAIEYDREDTQDAIIANYYLGLMHFHGYGTEQSYEKSAEWFKKGADQGDPDSMYMLALQYKDGKGVEQNLDEAIRLLKKAIMSDHTQSLIEMACIILTGETETSKSSNEGIKLLKRAGRLGDVDALLMLGEIYIGDAELDIEPDITTGIDYLSKAVNLGSDNAVYDLCCLLEDQEKTISDKERTKIIGILRELAEKGDTGAKKRL